MLTVGMFSFSRRWSWLAALCVACQIAIVVAPAIASATGWIIDEELCTCPGIEHGATCPMHHRTPARGTQTSRDDARRCTVKSATTSTGTAWLALAGPAVAPPVERFAFEPQALSVALDSKTDTLIARSVLPPLQPPRA